MKFLSDRLTSASGSIGGTTFSHNRGGLYTRARRVPVNPRTPFQQTVRNNLSLLQAAYPLLSSPDQQAWADCAEYMTFRDRLGSTIKYTAQQLYVMCNQPVMQAGDPPSSAAPTNNARADLTAPTAAQAASGPNVIVTFTPADTWANAVGGHLLVYASRPQNLTKNFFAGPYRLIGTIDGAVMPPASPSTLVSPFIPAPGQRIFYRFVAILPARFCPSSATVASSDA